MTGLATPEQRESSTLFASAILVGILVALWVMRRGGRIGLVAGSLLGANAMCLAMLPLLWLVMIPFR